MKVLALVVLLFVASSLGQYFAETNTVLKTDDGDFTITPTICADPTYNCTLNVGGSSWSFTPSTANNSGGIELTSSSAVVTLKPSRLPLGLLTLTFRAANSTLSILGSQQVTILIWDATAYTDVADLDSLWVATAVENNPARNLQWTPSALDLSGSDFDGAPYSFIDEENPSAPRDAPASAPLYWGNYYEIRLGLINDDTDTYCGSQGTWPVGTNNDDVAPTPAHPDWNATNSQGCPQFLEAGDVWTFPAPYQRVPNAADTDANGYNTVANQAAADNTLSNAGPLVWGVRNATGSSLVFTGLARPADWLAKCAPADTANNLPQNWPCYAERYNPDPQVWVVSATGVQPARITAIGATVTPSNQASPAVPLGRLFQTNEFQVQFVWPNIVTAVASADGVPAQAALTSVPTCSNPTFVGFNASGELPSRVKGVNFYPSCDQGLANNKAIVNCDETVYSNCKNSTDAAIEGADLATALQASYPVLNAVWISQRPLQISNGTKAVLNPGNGRATFLEVFYDAQQGTLPLTISFPLDAAQDGVTGALIRDNYWNFGANGSTNAGVVFITPVRVVECASNDGVCLPSGATPEYQFGNINAFFGNSAPPVLNVSAANPTTTLSFSGLPTPSAGKTWYMFFQVTDAAGTVYPYTSIPYLVIQLQDITTDWVNFPPDDNTFFITQPQTSAPGSYNYQIRIKRSPRSLGLDQIVVNWQVTGATNPLEFWVDGSRVTAFTFTGYQTVINFQVFTQQTPVGPFSLTFSSSSAFLDVSSLDLTGLFVAANPISIKTQNSSPEQGPYAGEPVWFELTFSPPATSSFTVTASGTGLFEGSKSVTVNVGDTGVLLGPVTPVLPQNVPLTAATYTIPVAFASSSAAYSVPSVVSLVVRRHTFVVTNGIRANGNAADESEIYLFTTGERSRPYCISTAYPVFNSSVVGATDSLTITFAAVDEDNNLAGLIFDPATVTLTAANPRQCVTIRADRLFPWDSHGGGDWDYDVTAYLGGSLAYMFQNPVGISDLADGENVWDFPHQVTVRRLTIEVELDESKLVADSDNVYALGETVQLRVWVDNLPPVGVNYTIVAPGVTIVPSTAGVSSTASHGRFGPAPASGAPAQWQAWDVTFGGYAGDISADDLNRNVEFTIYVSSGDAEFYRDSDPSPALGAVAVAQTKVLVVKRGVNVVYQDDEVAVKSLLEGTTTVSVNLQHPVVNGLTVNIVARQTNNASSAGLSFSTNALVFTPGGANSQSFDITGELLGEYQWTLYLTGPDADWFDLNLNTEDEDAYFTTEVTKRQGFLFTDFLGDAGTLYTGFTYGPVGINFAEPLNIGESITITPSGGDFAFTPASITLTAGQSSALFSFVYTGITQDAGEAVIFWSITGPSAWMYDYDAADFRQAYNFTTGAVDINFGTTTGIIPGTTHEGYVTLPFPVATDLTITPLAIGSAVTFSPATWTFTPATGTTLHFTYTVSATQAFALSGNSVAEEELVKRAVVAPTPSTDAAGLRIVFLASGTDADTFASFFAPVDLTLVRPEFRLDNTYGVNNVKEQTFDKHFIVGKWSTLYSIYLTSPPAAGGVTLTITDSQGVLEFLVGQSTTPATSAVLTFTADSYVQNFKFRFIKLLSGDSYYNGVEQLSVSVSGTNAAAYGFSNIFGGFQDLIVVPALAFSPIPAIYTDGSSNGLFVAVKGADGAIGGAWPYADDAQFTIHISVGDDFQSAVSIEPSTLEFSKSQSNDPVQSFRIVHTYPRAFGTARSYPLKFSIHFAGSDAAPEDITDLVPQDAQNVLLARYQIIPKFPHVLSYGWQSASINLSHIPVAHVSLTPRLPPVDGDDDVRGARAAGRVDFEPATIVAAPGQQVVNFKVKAQPGVHRDSLYYRVDWEVHGHEDDLVNWVEYLQKGSQGLGNGATVYFATWHLASAGATTISFALIAAVCFVAVVRNMF